MTVCHHCGSPIDVPVALGTIRRRDGCRANFPGSEYDPDEIEFLRAITRYKEVEHRPHPDWSEVLQILKALGYKK